MTNLPSRAARFFERAREVHGDTYDYTTSVYVSSHKHVAIVCREHGEFQQIASSHINRAAGCPICANNVRHTTQSFCAKAASIHNNVYDYSNVEYTGINNLVTIKCRIHGDFFMRAYSHIGAAQQGCPACGKGVPTQQQFLRRCINTHGDQYDLSQVQYVDMFTKIEVVCKKHGLFAPTPVNFLRGTGCPRCSCNISQGESQWLDMQGVPNTPAHRQLRIEIDGKLVKVDGFHDGVVYEFWGDFWHGNPSVFSNTEMNPKTKTTYGQLYSDTQAKRALILSAGYQLVETWESDWKRCGNAVD